ncbi:MAG: RNA polymerase sigma-54 factor [Candidatus Latescibacterota bacterium]|nr:MAG: RNA polymerase sigma-54 factor [Candidatus Latescibacteria bacterium 4484_107]RKY69812.1 MAG: RNA polymerase sigma-54 factor [Candidatus Latescibacterota bacterium]
MQLSQTLSLQQRLAPQLIQSLQLLQLPTLELEQLIRQELEMNPMLELEEHEEILQEEETRDEEESPEAEEELSSEFDEEDWTEYLEDGFNMGNDHLREFEREDEQQERRREIKDTETLMDRLLFQLHMGVSTPEDRLIGETILGNLDGNGYLASPLKEVAENLNVSVKDVERVLKIIQTFDPSGIAARDLRECLMIQLTEKGLKDSLAMKIVRDHFEDWTKWRHRELCQNLKISEDALRDAFEVISGLNPRPGADLFAETPRTIIPDVTIEKVDDDYVVLLNDRFTPSLRVSPAYYALLKDPKHTSPDAKSFILERLDRARWLINSIEQRRSTILKVVNAIIKNQRGFLEHGISFLKPMVLQDVAEEIGMHASTVSRVTSGKYVQTPQGVFELKFFFDNKVASMEGEDLSVKSVQDKIRQLIENEDPKKPLNDQKIADLLNEAGIDVARRTVAKYRDNMRIPSARYRKQL